MNRPGGRSGPTGRSVRIGGVGVCLLLLGLLPIWDAGPGPAAVRAESSVREAAPALSAEEAYRRRRSGIFLTAEGRVVRVLKDDRRGIPHQRFIIRLKGGQTLLVVHNTAVAPRVPVQAGDLIRVRGEYRWNAKGGLLHFTHRTAGPPRGRPAVGPGGWIRTRDGGLFR